MSPVVLALEPLHALHKIGTCNSTTPLQEVKQQMELPTRMNDIPHTRDKRRWFYNEVTQAMKAALDDGQTRMRIRLSNN